MIFNYCGCRLAYECEDYPIEIGCLLMGTRHREQTANSHEIIARRPRSTREGGGRRAGTHHGKGPHRQRAVLDQGPRPPADGVLLLRVLLHHTVRARRPARKVEPLFPHLEGITIEVTDECVGCGKCAKHCYVEAITVEDKRAVIGDYCRACGRCATVCPNDAIRITLDDPDFLDKTLERIGSYVKYDSR